MRLRAAAAGRLSGECGDAGFPSAIMVPGRKTPDFCGIRDTKYGARFIGTVKNKMIKNERNHRGHREGNSSLCSPKEFPSKDITEKIISCAIEVHSTLGPGLLESVYE